MTDAPDNIELTPAMIDAGYRVLVDSCLTEFPIEGADKLVIADIYRAMIAAAPKVEEPDAT